ncbi:HD domain-containing phosphohydrolase [Geomesophilobacter sediminis]|uniref:HD domain-containing protein n=1 Tax=Geomesophilobacter sediminis TaxID=2798584 RepID=A0A8J7JF51_9BACT|nr:HD domain-containing phosphohydrolase [Geomesophilobacter sediminis]MBJ6726036.1 HD domain-containing protein [Geomesophilobacter sediminis]
MPEESKKLQRIIELGLAISSINDLDLLLEKILQNARAFTNADAGSIYVREGDRLHFSYTQNETFQQNLPAGQKLVYSSFSIPIDNSSIAGWVTKNGKMINLPDVYHLPAGSPYSFDSSYDRISGYRTCSMLTFPLKTTRGDVAGVLQLINAKDADGKVSPFQQEDEAPLIHYANSAAAALERAKLMRGAILRMNKMAEMRDPKETGAHVKRVSSYALVIYEGWAQRKGVSRDEVERSRDLLRMAAMLHDVGKVAISDVIMKKPGRFTPEEFEIMKQHTVIGARLFEELFSDMDEAACVVALNHHERWDGAGYPGNVDFRSTGAPSTAPQGKKGEEIPLFGRIVAVADVFDALSSQRCYKEAWDEDKVLEEMKSQAGRQFDPELVEIFLENLTTIRQIKEMYPEAD